ncbi:MAG TPA: hypothetical protein EYP33_06935 [Pyrodictium sp.]|nr:hypothetical protein [Pyrodictium sp.]
MLVYRSKLFKFYKLKYHKTAMPLVRRRNIFIPHPWNKYKDTYEWVKNKVKRIPYLGKKIADYSAPPYKPVPAKTELGTKKLIGRKIKQSNVVIVPATKAIYYHKFTMWEIKRAKREEKPIIVVKKKGKPVPRILRKVADYIITRTDKLREIFKKI